MANIDLKILQALKSDEKKDIGIDENGQKKLRITKGAHAKANMYAKLVSKIAGGGMECYGYQLKSAESFDDLVKDVYFADGQDAKSVYVSVTPEGVKKAGDYATKNGFEILGWWHSHGSMNVFHSGTDKNNFEVILHSIAPQTMYKKEEAVFQLKDDTLCVDNYTLEGVSPKDGKKIKIIKKVERDPFAFSMVVNERGDNYRECITKTFNHNTKEFDLNEPYHPKLELVDVANDVKFDIPDMEWEIYKKVSMNKQYGGTQNNDFFECKEYDKITSAFISSATNYVKNKGKYQKTLGDMLIADEKTSRYDQLRNANNNLQEKTNVNNGIEAKFVETKLGKEITENEITDNNITEELIVQNKDEITDLLKAPLQRTNFRSFTDPNTKFKKYELENLIFLQFMIDFVKMEQQYQKNVPERAIFQDMILEKYKERANTLKECASLAEGIVKSVPRYGMEEFTDYKKEKDNKYRRLMSNIMANMATDTNYTFLDSVKKETSKNPTSGFKMPFFLYEDRMNIFNQLVKDLYYIKTGKCNSLYKQNVLEFAKDFPKAYLENKNIDEIVEKNILPIKVTEEKFESYQDVKLQQNNLQQKQKNNYSPIRAIMRYGKWILPQFMMKSGDAYGHATNS